MPQVSRPLQVALAAVGLLVVVWFVALRGHSSSSEPTATTPASSPQGSSAGVYHGSAPGVEGLTRDIQKAHAAAGQSEHASAQLQQKAAQASGEAAATPAASATPSANGSAPAKALARKTQAKSPSTKATTRPTTATPHAVSRAVSVPVIASGGAGRPEDLAPAIEAGADAVLCASIFHYGRHTVAEVKRELAGAGVPVREPDHDPTRSER